jgi:hypothetical protein
LVAVLSGVSVGVLVAVGVLVGTGQRVLTLPVADQDPV